MIPSRRIRWFSPPATRLYQPPTIISLLAAAKLVSTNISFSKPTPLTPSAIVTSRLYLLVLAVVVGHVKSLTTLPQLEALTRLKLQTKPVEYCRHLPSSTPVSLPPLPPYTESTRL